MARHGEGAWHGGQWDGKTATSFPLNETDEKKARQARSPRGQVKYRRSCVILDTLLYFVVYSLPHAHEIPARQG